MWLCVQCTHLKRASNLYKIHRFKKKSSTMMKLSVIPTQHVSGLVVEKNTEKLRTFFSTADFAASPWCGVPSVRAGPHRFSHAAPGCRLACRPPPGGGSCGRWWRGAAPSRGGRVDAFQPARGDRSAPLLLHRTSRSITPVLYDRDARTPPNYDRHQYGLNSVVATVQDHRCLPVVSV